jgi:hypothetical protein
MIHDAWKKIAEEKLYLEALKLADEEGNFGDLKSFLDDCWEKDDYRLFEKGKRGVKYRVGLIHTVQPKILAVFKKALRTGELPVLPISTLEAKATLKNVGLGALESPQDFVYAFTSERYPGWGNLLERTGFQSAGMSGEGQMELSIAPRYLEVGKPDLEVDELFGAIPNAFLEAANILNTDQSLLGRVEDVLGQKEFKELNLSELSTGDVVDELAKKIVSKCKEVLPKIIEVKLKNLLEDSDYVKLMSSKSKTASIRSHVRKFYNVDQSKISKQEQIVLKFLEEGRFLQKLLGGASLVDIQSNVKMVPNILRGNKCEVDRIYRVVGENRVVLVEAKAGEKVSRTQLYQIYETYRMKLPQNWKIDVVAALLHQPTQEQKTEKDVAQVIDVIEVEFDKNCFGNMAESIYGIRPKKHVQWLIKHSV